VAAALVVRGGHGALPREEAGMMVTRGRNAKLVELADARHDLHLDHPAEWRQALGEFLDSRQRERRPAA
jgi:pimeloyl-ACP methyl ester carboxylesterase